MLDLRDPDRDDGLPQSVDAVLARLTTEGERVPEARGRQGAQGRPEEAARGAGRARRAPLRGLRRGHRAHRAGPGGHDHRPRRAAHHPAQREGGGGVQSAPRRRRALRGAGGGPRRRGHGGGAAHLRRRAGAPGADPGPGAGRHLRERGPGRAGGDHRQPPLGDLLAVRAAGQQAAEGLERHRNEDAECPGGTEGTKPLTVQPDDIPLKQDDHPYDAPAAESSSAKPDRP